MFGQDRTRCQVQCHPHPGQDRGIHAVCLGYLADRLGEPSNLPRIDLGEGQALPRQRLLEIAVVGTGRLEHDEHVAPLASPSTQSCQPSRVVGKPSMILWAGIAGVQVILRNVYADRVLHGHVPPPRLVMRASRPGIRLSGHRYAMPCRPVVQVRRRCGGDLTRERSLATKRGAIHPPPLR
jgi:hypothetical protein